MFGLQQSDLENNLYLHFSTSSITAWSTDAHEIKPQITPGLQDVFLFLVEAAENSNVDPVEGPHST